MAYKQLLRNVVHSLMPVMKRQDLFPQGSVSWAFKQISLIKEYYVDVYAITLQLLAKKDEYRMSAAESVTSDRNDNTYKDGGQ